MFLSYIYLTISYKYLLNYNIFFHNKMTKTSTPFNKLAAVGICFSLWGHEKSLTRLLCATCSV